MPIDPGFVTFEVPDDLDGREVILIVGATARGGSYRGRCVVEPGRGDGSVPTLMDLGRVLDVSTRAPRIAEDRGEPAPIDEGARLPAFQGRPPLHRSFSVLVRPGDPTSPSNYAMVDARLRALGERIQVFVDEDDIGTVADEVLRGIVSCFDRVIEPTLSGWIGRPIDVDRDGRFTVLLSRRVGLPYADRCHVDGYFRSADLDAELPRPLSNRADLIYLNAGLTPGPYLETILAHEYAHAVLASRRREHFGPIPEEAWLDEAMAHLCEDRVGRSTTNLDYRASAFLSNPSRYRLLVDEEYRPGLFRTHGNRGAAYLFLRWCAEAFDPDLPRTLAFGTATGAENLEREIGQSFESLQQQWSVALALGSLGRPSAFVEGIDLLNSIGDWPIGGVRFLEVGADHGPESFSIEGTGRQFLRVSTLRDGPTRIRVECDPSAVPSLTAVLVDGSLPRLSLDVSIVDQGPDSATLSVQVEELAGIPVRLDRLSWEALTPPQDLPRTAHQPGLIQGDELQRLFPGLSLPPAGRLTSEPFQIPATQLARGPVAVRLSAQDADGNRVVAWSVLDPSAPRLPTRPPSFAGRGSPFAQVPTPGAP